MFGAHTLTSYCKLAFTCTQNSYSNNFYVLPWRGKNMCTFWINIDLPGTKPVRVRALGHLCRSAAWLPKKANPDDTESGRPGSLSIK